MKLTSPPARSKRKLILKWGRRNLKWSKCKDGTDDANDIAIVDLILIALNKIEALEWSEKTEMYKRSKE